MVLFFYAKKEEKIHILPIFQTKKHILAKSALDSFKNVSGEKSGKRDNRVTITCSMLISLIRNVKRQKIKCLLVIRKKTKRIV